MIFMVPSWLTSTKLYAACVLLVPARLSQGRPYQRGGRFASVNSSCTTGATHKLASYAEQCATIGNHRNCCHPRTTAEENKLPTDTTLGENDRAIVTPGGVLARAVQVVIGLVSCPSRWTASPPSYLRAYLTYIHTYVRRSQGRLHERGVMNEAASRSQTHCTSHVFAPTPTATDCSHAKYSGGYSFFRFRVTRS